MEALGKGLAILHTTASAQGVEANVSIEQGGHTWRVDCVPKQLQTFQKGRFTAYEPLEVYQRQCTSDSSCSCPIFAMAASAARDASTKMQRVYLSQMTWLK